MDSPESIRPIPRSTSDALLARCGGAEEGAGQLRAWVISNPWLDGAKVELIMPEISYICFAWGSRELALFQLGEEGWTVGMSGEIRKTMDGVIVAVAGEL